MTGTEDPNPWDTLVPTSEGVKVVRRQKPPDHHLEAAEIAKLASPALDNMAREAMTASGRHAARRILLKRERAITASMRRYLDLETLVSVRLVRPRWMPRPVYRWLLRTIVFEEIATR